MNRKEAEAYLATIPEDEPVFVIRAQDRLAAAAVRDWKHRAQACGSVPQEKIDGAEAVAKQMQSWPRQKWPD